MESFWLNVLETCKESNLIQISSTKTFYNGKGLRENKETKTGTGELKVCFQIHCMLHDKQQLSLFVWRLSWYKTHAIDKMLLSKSKNDGKEK